ncbi:hypothetical protein ABZ215_24820 [Amycolatopsis sp. NPDC006131]|uniref:hypothetical protein n=1 Tax=Amycolatopsis sp. NPDC006131 TaxID=3156731 RepID=UPI0033AFF0D5
MTGIHDQLTEYYQRDRVPAADVRTMALAALLLQRHDWPRLQIVTNDRGSYDIVIRVDGGYADLDDAKDVLRTYAVDAARLQFGESQVPPLIERGDD